MALADLTSEELALLVPDPTDGTLAYELWKGAGLTVSGSGKLLVAFEAPADARRLCSIVARVRFWGQDVSVCGVGASGAGADAWVASSREEVITKGALSYTITETAEVLIRSRREEGGGVIVPHDCPAPDYDNPGEPPGWEEETGGVSSEVTYDGVKTGAEISGAAKAAEVLLFDSGFLVGARFARRWFDSNTFEVGLSFEVKAEVLEVRRVTVDFEAVGFRCPINLKWTRTVTPDVGDPTTSDEVLEFRPGAWALSIEEDYPAYKSLVTLNGFRLEPVV